MDIISIAVGAGIGILATYLYFRQEMKLVRLEQSIKEASNVIKSISELNIKTLTTLGKQIDDVANSIPTPMEVAKEVVKIKLPISELPPELQEQISNMKQQHVTDRNPLVG